MPNERENEMPSASNNYDQKFYPPSSISTGSPPSSRRTSSSYDSQEDPLLCGFGRLVLHKCTVCEDAIFSCTPSWLQHFHNAKWLLTMLGICAFVQSLVVNSIFPVGLSTLEKRFHMTR